MNESLGRARIRAGVNAADELDAFGDSDTLARIASKNQPNRKKLFVFRIKCGCIAIRPGRCSKHSWVLSTGLVLPGHAVPVTSTTFATVDPLGIFAVGQLKLP